MVYTVTFNPSLDYIVSVNNFQMGMTNRTCAEQMLPGGKGINVSTVLYNLGIETKALGFPQVLLEKKSSAEWRKSDLHMILFLYRTAVPESMSN